MSKEGKTWLRFKANGRESKADEETIKRERIKCRKDSFRESRKGWDLSTCQTSDK